METGSSNGSSNTVTVVLDCLSSLSYHLHLRSRELRVSTDAGACKPPQAFRGDVERGETNHPPESVSGRAFRRVTFVCLCAAFLRVLISSHQLQAACLSTFNQIISLHAGSSDQFKTQTVSYVTLMYRRTGTHGISDCDII